MKPASALRTTLLSVVISLTLAGCSGGDGDNMSQEEIQYLSHMDQSRFFQRQGELKASTLEARSAIELQPEDPEPYFVIIDNLLLAGDAQNAERQLDQLLSSIPRESLSSSAANKASLIRAEANMMQGDYDEALAALDDLSSTDRSVETQAALLRGEINLLAGQLDASREAYENARANNASSALPLVGLSRVEFAREDIEGARALITEAEEVDAENPQLWLWKAQFAFSQEQWSTAEDAYIRALEDIGQYDVMTFEKYQTISALIQVLREQGKSSEAFVYEEILAKSGPGTMRSNLIAAQEAYQNGNLIEAARYLEEVQAQAPGHEQSALLLGMIRFHQGRVEEAEKLLAPVAGRGEYDEASKLLAAARLQMRDPEGAQAVLDTLENRDSDPGTLALVGIASLSSGDRETGESLIEKSLELNPDNHQLRIRYANYLSQTGDPDRAIEQARQVIDKAPDQDQAWTIAIETMESEGDLQGALQTASRWLEERPDHLTALIARGNLAANRDNFDEARRFFTAAREKHPESAAPLISLGRLAISEDNPEDAEQRLREAVQLAPDSRQALQGLASLLETQQLRAFMREVLDNQPEAIGPKLVLLEIALRDGDLAEAEELTASLIERQEQDTPARAEPLVARIYNSVPNTLARDDNRERAAEILERGRVLFPENQDIALQAAGLAFQNDDASQARKILQETKQQHPDSPRPYLLEAAFFQRNGEFQQAADLYELALEKEASPETKAAFAQALQRAGREEDALARLTTAVEEHPETPRLRLNLAMMQQSMGAADAALANYERLLEISPNNALVMNNLAWLYHEQGNDRALELAERAYELSPENAAIADTYGWILFQSGNQEESLPVLEKAHALQPDSEEIGLHLAEAYKASGRNSEAQEILEKFGGQG